MSLCASCKSPERLVTLGAPDGAHVLVCPYCANRITAHVVEQSTQPPARVVELDAGDFPKGSDFAG